MKQAIELTASEAAKLLADAVLESTGFRPVRVIVTSDDGHSVELVLDVPA